MIAPNSGERLERGKNNGTAILEEGIVVTYKIKQVSAYDPEISLLGFKPEKLGHVHTKTCTLIFVAALFIITPNWK